MVDEPTAAQGQVIVRVEVVRTVLEPYTDARGREQYNTIDRRIVSEREWVESREKAMAHVR